MASRHIGQISGNPIAYLKRADLLKPSLLITAKKKQPVDRHSIAVDPSKRAFIEGDTDQVLDFSLFL